MWQLGNGGAIAVRASAMEPEIWFYSPNRVGDILNLAESRQLPVLPRDDAVTLALRKKCVNDVAHPKTAGDRTAFAELLEALRDENR